MTPFGSDVSIFFIKKQIYLVNTPMVFRAVWTCVKPWLHPLTLNKIQVCFYFILLKKHLKKHIYRGYTPNCQ